MRFRRRTSFRGTKRFREPLMWRRNPGSTAVDISGTFGAVISTILFDPTAEVAGAQDLRLTLRRLRFSTALKQVYSAGANIPLIQTFGVAVVDAAMVPANFPNPGIVGTADEQTDWIWKTTTFIAQGSAAVVLLSGPSVGAFNNLDGQDLPSIRAMRKLEQDKVIRLFAAVSRADPAADAAPTVTRQALFSQANVLYSRTGR